MSEKGIAKVESMPEGWRGRRVGLMDALLYTRERVTGRRGLWSVTGFDTVESLFSFTMGWASNTQFNSEPDAPWCDFLDWLDEVESQARLEGWQVTFLRECDGDHERAAMRLLDRAQEFVSHGRRSQRIVTEQRVVKEEPIPEAWRGRGVGLMDALLYAREQIHKKRGLWFVTGFDTVESLFAFTMGWASNTQFNGGEDLEWQAFWDWLRDEKKEMPPEGWHVKYLRDCAGDHERAVMKFLDRAQEFVSSRRAPPKP